MAARILLLIIYLWIFAAVPLNAQVTETARTYIEDLCTPGMHGRGYAGKGDKLAARYIASAYDSIGLEKVSGSWYQPFRIRINTQSSDLLLKIDNKELVPGVDYIVDKGSPSFRGQGTVQHIERLDFFDNDWMEQISEGAFLLLNNNITGEETAEQTKLLNEMIALLRYSLPASCKALIINSDSKLTLKGFRERLPVPVVYMQTGKDLSAAGSVYFEVKSKFDPDYKTRNVLAYLEGEKYPDSLIIFTAHYDHMGRMGSEVYFPGANDNASGIAMILSLAEHYARSENRPDFSMLFIAFSAEEIGLLGSDFYASHPAYPLLNTKFLINIDLAGNGEEGITVVNGSIHKSRFELLKKINDSEQYLPVVKSRGEACNSDHCPFHKMDVPAFFIYTMGGSTAYHDIYDTPESLPLTMFENYYNLLVSFTDSIQK